MKKRLFEMPLTRAYVMTTLVGGLPFMILAIFGYRYMGDSNSSVETLRAKIGAANEVGGKIAGGEISTSLQFHHVVGAWAIASALLFILCGLILRVMLGNNTLRAVERMVNQVRTAAGGDLRVEPTIEAKNEYGDLQEGFSAMVGGFRQTIGRIDGAASDLKHAAAEMSHTADEAGQAIGEVAQAIGAISEGASHQVALVGHSAELVAGIEGSVRDTSEHAREAQRQSADTEKLADEGVQRAAEVQDAMQAVRESSLSTAEVIRSLGAKSSDIDQIVQAITSIAHQTNMLALNASIEAARAGEQGKGFANVADEVRLLAEDAQASASEIAVLVREIQTQTAEAVAAMEDGVVRVEEGFDTVNRNRQTFFDISSAVRGLHESSTEISELADGIATSTSQVRSQIEGVASVAEESSASTEQVSASTQETSAAAQEVSASAQKVAHTAANLAELSGRFQLPAKAA
jgi:methyl-accepting chemotaxis protein